MLIRSVIMLHVLHCLLHAAQPAPRPWPRRPGRPVTGLPTAADTTDRPGHRACSHEPPSRVIDTPADPGRTRRGHRGASRRRGRRGGVDGRRHGENGSGLLIGHLNIQSYKPKLPDLRHDIGT